MNTQHHQRETGRPTECTVDMLLPASSQNAPLPPHSHTSLSSCCQALSGSNYLGHRPEPWVRRGFHTSPVLLPHPLCTDYTQRGHTRRLHPWARCIPWERRAASHSAALTHLSWAASASSQGVIGPLCTDILGCWTAVVSSMRSSLSSLAAMDGVPFMISEKFSCIPESVSFMHAPLPHLNLKSLNVYAQAALSALEPLGPGQASLPVC